MNESKPSTREGYSPLPEVYSIVGDTAHRTARNDLDGDATWDCHGLLLVAALASAHGLQMAEIDRFEPLPDALRSTPCSHCRPFPDETLRLRDAGHSLLATGALDQARLTA